ncbi:MAG TPA: hypothetical protein VHA11_02050, partial [Bryobacteraceae bacterium]|nr:hypothetical protein [Bryobacteraceae bacterium]
ELWAVPSGSYRTVTGTGFATVEPALLKVEQNNTSIVYGDRAILKLFRRLEPGINPELDAGFFLSEKARFEHVPHFAGALEYRHDGETMTVGVLQGFVPNQGDAWKFTVDALSGYYEAAVTIREKVPEPPRIEPISLALLETDIPAEARDLIGAYLESAKLLGRRTAELHQAFASNSADPNFAPEPFTDFYRQSLYHGMLGQAGRSLTLLRQRLKQLNEPALSDARRVLALEPEIRKRFQLVRDRRIDSERIRCHGDYSLDQVLYTGKDFYILDFEGDPSRPISERRMKRSPLRDVASMMRSFFYAAHSVLFGVVPGVLTRPEDWPVLEQWARYWNRWVALAFLREYLAATGPARFLPQSRESLGIMLLTYVLDRTMNELDRELTFRPDWVRIPLHGILQLMETPWLQ